MPAPSFLRVAAKGPVETSFAPLPFWRRHSRLLLGIGVALATSLVLSVGLGVNGRLSFIWGFDLGALATLLALYFRFRRASAAQMKQDAVGQDAGQYAVLAFVLTAATASLVVIATEMPRVKDAVSWMQLAHAVLVIVTIILSWTFIQTIFALHYAHDYFIGLRVPVQPGDEAARRLIFPGGALPTYSDFLYFSFTIGMTFQVSDVQIADAAIRRMVLLHGVVAFFFTTGILALTINLVAGLL